MTAARSKRLAKAIASGVAGRSAVLAAPLIVTPLLLNHIGDTAFGAWATSTSITSAMVFLDLGISNSLLTRVSQSFGREDFASIRRQALSAYAILAAVAAGAILAIQAVAHIAAVNEAVLIATTVVIVFLVGLPINVTHQLLYGLQRVPTSNALLAMGAFLSVGSTIAAVNLNLAPWEVVLAYSVPPVLVTLLGATWLFWKNPRLRPRVTDFDFRAIVDLMMLGSRFFVLSIITAIALNVDNLIIALNAGANSVTSYSILARLGSLPSLLILTLFMPLWSANGEAIARGEHAWVRRSAFWMSLGGSVLVALCGIGLVLMSEHILQLWIGRTYPAQQLILSLMVAVAVATAAVSPFNMVLNALGAASAQIGPWLIFGLGSITFKLILVEPTRLWVAPMISLCLYLVIIAPFMVLEALRQLEAGRAEPSVVAPKVCFTEAASKKLLEHRTTL